MASINRCIFIGNVTKEVELKFMASGEAVANFTIAVNETWKAKDGSKQERVEWVNIVAYRKLAEIIGEYVKKGASIYVEGKMQTRKWEKDGVTRYATEIICDQMQMLGGKSDNNERSDTNTQPSNNNAPSKQESGYDDENEPPF